MPKEVTYYPAHEDPTAPFGWKAESGLYFRPDWGDRLIDINGVPHIAVSRFLEGATEDTTARPEFLTLADLQTLGT